MNGAATPPGAKPTSTQRAVQELRRLIFSGDLAAGSDHLEAELAARFGMSRTPVREAALILEGQGLLEMRPRRGVRILTVSVADMAEIYDVLTALESHAAAQAAASDHAGLDELEAAIDAMDRALDRGDLDQWAAADERFHTELVRLGGNARIIGIVAMMQDQVRRARQATLFLRPKPTRSNRDHRDVLTAIRLGRPDDARRIHHAHRVAAKHMLLALLKDHRIKRV